MPDHVHMLVEIPPKMSVSGFVGYLKGKSSLMIYEKWGESKIQIPEPRILVQGVLCGYGGKECNKNKGVHREPTKRG